MPRNQKKNDERLRRFQAGKSEVKQYSQKIDRAFSRLSEDCSNRVIRATSLGSLRDKPAPEEVTERKNRRIFYRDTNPFGNKIHAVQKMRGKSTLLI